MGGKTFLPENMCIKITKLVNKITQFYITFALKINKISEFCIVFARKMPEFYMIIAQKYFPDYFWGKGTCTVHVLLCMAYISY